MLFHAAFRRKMPGKSLLHCWKVMMMWASEWVLLEGAKGRGDAFKKWCADILIERCGIRTSTHTCCGVLVTKCRGLFLWGGWFAISYCSIVVLLYTFCYCGRFVVSQTSFGGCTLLPHGSLVFIVHCIPLKLSPRTKALLMICEQHGVLTIFEEYTAEIGQRRMNGFAYGCPFARELTICFVLFLWHILQDTKPADHWTYANQQAWLKIEEIPISLLLHVSWLNSAEKHVRFKLCCWCLTRGFKTLELNLTERRLGTNLASRLPMYCKHIVISDHLFGRTGPNKHTTYRFLCFFWVLLSVFYCSFFCIPLLWKWSPTK